MKDENGTNDMDYFRGNRLQWNDMPQHHPKDTYAIQNMRFLSILHERDNAIRERNTAIAETKEALIARDEALKQRDEAIAERDRALVMRDNAREALQHLENAINSSQFAASGMKRAHNYESDNSKAHITDAIPLSTITAEAVESSCLSKQSKEKRGYARKKKKGKTTKLGEVSNYYSEASPGIKVRSEWDDQDVGLNLIVFDDSTMPGPICSCTGEARSCYKWGNCGWQSSCCTTRISMYPLPQMPNKCNARMSGRKMSGSVFTRLLTRMSRAGHDLSVPLDLKDYWARHGTNRYITIK